MPEYRFFAINKEGHVSGQPISYDFPNDAAALKEAKKLIDGHDIEVRQDKRVVAYLTPDNL